MKKGYRYGFNGKENDAESGTQDYGMRIYNPALGKFLSVDPITAQYPELTPYQFASNRPIDGIDLDGKEYVESTIADNKFFSQLGITFADDVEKQTKKSSKKIKLDNPEKEKKPLTDYQSFVKTTLKTLKEREDAKEEGEEKLKQKDLMKEVGELWKQEKVKKDNL